MKVKNYDRNIIGILALIFIMLGAVSCGSTPPEEEPLPPAPVEAPVTGQPTAPGMTDLEALEAARARALAAQSLAAEFNGANLFPSEWANAASLLNTAESQMNTTNQQNTRDSTARFIAAAEAMEALAELALNRNWENTLQELNRARSAAVNAGAERLSPTHLAQADSAAGVAGSSFQARNYIQARDEALSAISMYNSIRMALDAFALRDEVAYVAQSLVPDYLERADNIADLALQSWDAGDYIRAEELIRQAEEMYAALNIGITAYNMREEIDSMGFQRFDINNFVMADDALFNAGENFLDGNYVYARTRAEDAARRYAQVQQTAWRLYAAERNNAAEAQRAIAIQNRANVAVREEFNAAQLLYSRGATVQGEARYREAVSLFIESEAQFADVARIALERRQAAEEALIQANQRMAESDETARNVEAILRGGTTP